ncbi:hypothetical protein C0Q44_00905 [Paenibacillus sp. PCH8]|uniref:outer membrane protein assembly factor BamB family protein n=1 Tax=Paenibacillus sp. PCH8 TaxID=2066524 RepID=UPI000CF9B4B8|nr:PQQ-binding-like beta-propeller repeat protein [Paenibacillus sp. PCH8]PQP83316.1 hypothetical protein C0Q44_00905 [Paenibacillus sp. PCH8]
MKTGPDWQRMGYKWVTLTGLSAVLLTGWILLDANRVALGGQVSTTTPQALGAGSQSSSLQLAYKQGDTVTLMADIPLFNHRMDSSVAADLMRIESYSTGKTKYKVSSIRGEWIQLNEPGEGKSWVPTWYVLKESKSIKKTPLQNFTLQAGSKLYLSPDSSETWIFDKALTDQAIIVAEWKGWYGVSIAPQIWNKESSTYRPALLWMKERDIEQRSKIAEGWFSQGAAQSTSAVRHMTDIRLNTATTSKQLEQWLGAPDWKEHSSNLNDTGYAMSIGNTWRYEREDAQFLVTFNKNGKLVRTRWNIPLDKRNNVVPDGSFNRLREYEFTTKIAGKVLPTTLPWEPVWANQGDLNYTFLQAGTDDVLLMKGDDGGFSGMHYDSSIYALDRHTGRKLWRVHAGFGADQAQLNDERNTVTIFTSYNLDDKKYKDRVRQLRLNDGHALWEYNPKQEARITTIKSAKNVVIVESAAAEGSSNGRIHVLNSANGKMLWTRKLSKGYQLFNKSADEAYVLYWEKNQLVAADPLSGRTIWRIKTGKPTMDHPETDPYFDGIYRTDPFASGLSERWMLLRDQWVLLDLNTGEKLAQFPARYGQQFEVLNDGMVLIRENKSGGTYGDYEDYTTLLYDAKIGKNRWTLNGKIERGLVEDGQLYVIKNGYPAALDYETGMTRWNAKDTIRSLKYPTNQGSYLVIDDQLLLPMDENLLVLNKTDGSLLGRVYDVVMGSPEHRDRYAKNGTINRIGNEVYVGSSNGRFSVYEANRLQGEIFP